MYYMSIAYQHILSANLHQTRDSHSQNSPQARRPRCLGQVNLGRPSHRRALAHVILGSHVAHLRQDQVMQCSLRLPPPLIDDALHCKKKTSTSKMQKQTRIFFRNTPTQQIKWARVDPTFRYSFSTVCVTQSRSNKNKSTLLYIIGTNTRTLTWCNFRCSCASRVVDVLWAAQSGHQHPSAAYPRAPQGTEVACIASKSSQSYFNPK